MNWRLSTQALTKVLEQLAVSDGSGASIQVDEGFALLKQWVEDCKNEKRRVYFVGNGASASMASHFSTDLAKNADVPTEVFTDCSLITATGNDFGYDHTFAYPLGQRMVAGEVLVAISSSGNSPNIVSAVEKTRELNGRSVTMSAMAPHNRLRTSGDLNFYIPANTYGLAETGHAAVLHHLVDIFFAEKERSK